MKFALPFLKTAGKSEDYKFQRWQFFEPLAPPLGERDIYAYRLFFTKFNTQQLLFEQFFDIIGNFGSVQLESEPTFPFHYNIMFSYVLEQSLINENFGL